MSGAGDAARLATHAAACEDCRAAPLPLPALAALLDAVPADVDPAALSGRVRILLRAQLQQRAQRVVWRRVLRVVLAALLPLPLIAGYDAYVLHAAYALGSALLPSALVTYLVASYAALLLLLFALTYAAIPVLVWRQPPSAAAEW